MRAKIFEITGVLISAALFGLFSVILVDTREPFALDMMGIFVVALLSGVWGVCQRATWVGAIYAVALMILGFCAAVAGTILFIPWMLTLFALYGVQPWGKIGFVPLLSLPVYAVLPAFLGFAVYKD
ncbi:hypothetical protein [Paenirhodobacter populi]|uniref:Uncharacterized protein n=1 Tax=Paenirhodobacter populi TaxID=2306993 RepID=A0A443J091_9RHOB|nr:hypothetical protein [Sinirhodobacter populi]RWR13806.1 hypothetical protein D2T33_05255 [Sinirhodobacter populi]